MKKKAFIPISALVVALLLAIIAAMTPFVAERNLAYAQTNSDIATLSRLTVSPGTLSPVFDPAKLIEVAGDGSSGTPYEYTVNVRHSVSSLTVSATKTDRNATVAYIVNDGTDGTPSTSGRISLAVGDSNVVVVRVTAEDGVIDNRKYYRVTITRASSTASPDATLDGLSVSPGTLSPAFMAAKTEYSVDLAYDAINNAAVTLTAMATQGDDAVVTVKKDGKVVALTGIPIDEGDNTITVDVLAPDFVATKTYTLTINRARVNASGDARLSSLSLSDGTLMPAFDAADLPADADDTPDAAYGTTPDLAHAYEVSVPHNIVEVTVMAGTMDSGAKWAVTIETTDNTDPPDSDTTRSGHQVDVTAGGGGDTVIDITVTAEDRTTEKHYQVTVTRAPVSASTDATVSALTVDPGMVEDADAPDTMKLGEKFEYSVDLPYGFDDKNPGTDAPGSQVTVVVTPSENNAVVTVKKGTKVISGTVANNVYTYSVTIDVGDNTITADVLAPDYTAMKTYTLTINRARANASDDARLSSLSLSRGMLMPAFDPAKLPDNDSATDENTGTTATLAHPYADSVPNSVESLTVMAEAMNSNAMVSITNNGSPVSGGAVDLIVDDEGNVIVITVTAEDRTTEKHYEVTVYRAHSGASDDATLSALTVDPGMVEDADAPDTMKLGEKFEYSVDLPNGFDDKNPGTDAPGSQVTVVVTPSEENNAVVTVKKGTTVISGIVANNVYTYSVTIDAGDNTITVDVLAPDYATMKTYTLTINRAGRNTSDDARLSSLSLSRGTLMPAFDPAKLPADADDTPDAAYGTIATLAHAYEVNVPNSVESLTVMAEAMNSNAMVSITNNGSPVSGGAVDLIVGGDGNEIDITVTAEDRATKKHYQVTVTRVAATASSNATLSDLMLITPIVTLDPAFDAANLPALMGGAHHFSASASRGTSSIMVVPTAADLPTNVDDDLVGGASVTVMFNMEIVEPDPAPPGQYKVELLVGDNVVTVMVTAENVIATKTYKITINRPGTGNAALSDLSLSGLTLNEPFGTAADDAYTADAASSVESTTVMATAVQSNATISILPGDADSAMDGHQVALTPGTNTIAVTVIAGGNTRDYTVTVTVAPPVDGDLLDMYDADNDNQISKDEAIAAINDYLFGEGDQQITKAQVIEVINLYLFG